MILSTASILSIVGDLGPIVSTLSIIVAIMALRANHDWNRRHFASQMISNWNKQTKPFIDDIEMIEPGIIDFGKDNRITQITQREAHAIYYSNVSDDSKEWKLRTRFIHLLNELESIAAAYKNAVGDRQMIEESFRDIFVKWGFVLEHFINIYKEQRKNPKPWGPYHDLYDRWSHGQIEKLKNPTGKLTPL
jgi:hypothetical protein